MNRAIIAVLVAVFLSGCLNYEALQRASEDQKDMAASCSNERIAMWNAVNGENVAKENEGMLAMTAAFVSVLSPCGKGQTNALDVLIAFGQIQRDLTLGVVPVAQEYSRWRGLSRLMRAGQPSNSTTTVQNSVEVSDEASYTGDFASNVGGNQAAGSATQSVGSAQGGSILDSNDAQLGNTVDQRGGDGENAGNAGDTQFSPVDANSDTDVF